MKNFLFLLCYLFFLTGSLFAQTKVIAHRGYWNCNGAAMNSVAAMKNACDINAYGSEFDVHMTKDGVIVVNHDDDIHGILIERANYAEIKDLKLSNGETLPTLRQYLAEGKKLGKMRLVLEVKEHETVEMENRCVAEAVSEVAEAGLQNRVDYISFSMNACEEILKVAPKAAVYYLGGDVAPETIKEKGFAGIDYSGTTIKKNPHWIDLCHKLGLKVNVWTIDEVCDIQKFVDANVDYITTNKPVEAIKIAEGKIKF